MEAKEGGTKLGSLSSVKARCYLRPQKHFHMTIILSSEARELAFEPLLAISWPLLALVGLTS
jgi:hypothetical protein